MTWALFLLAAAPVPPVADKGGLLRSALALWLALACGGAILVLGVSLLLSLRRKRRRARERLAAPAGRPIKDAWAESARRLEVQPPDSPEEDDLRVDR